MTIRAAIFDLDGVLVESEHLWERSWSDLSTRHGARWTTADTRRLQGMSVREWSLALARHAGLAEDRADEVARTCVDLVVREVSDGEADLLDGAASLLAAAHARVPVALASSAARRVIEAVLARHDLRDVFAATVSSEEVARGKPHPDVYLEAARRLAVLPAQCMSFEDSSNGIRSASAAGTVVVAIPNSAYPPTTDARAVATFVVRDHAEAERLLCQEIAMEESR